MLSELRWKIMKLMVRVLYGFWPVGIHVYQAETPAEQAEREKAAREFAAKVMADLGTQRRFRMGVGVDDTLTDLPPITTAPIRGDN